MTKRKRKLSYNSAKHFRNGSSMEPSLCWTWSKRVNLKLSQKKRSADHQCKFNGAAHNLQMCHMLQTKRKNGIPENDRPIRRNMPGSSYIHLIMSWYVWTNLGKRKIIRPQTLSCSPYTFIQLFCVYRTYQYNWY